MKLSVVLATYNEEGNIAKCLEPVMDMCDEIVVVDGSSTDSTVSIAKKFNAKILITDNPPIFHINKQKAIDLARNEWVLQLDADEIVTPELKNEILETLKHPEKDGYWMPRKNYFLGRFLMKGGVYPDYTLRLYKKSKGRLPQEDVHEQAEVSGTSGYLSNPLIHMADISLSRYFVRFARYTDLLASQIRNKKQNPLFLFFNYVLIKPIFWFFMIYFRHLGFLDSWQGFLFSFFSSLRYPVSYYKYKFKKT